MRGSPTISRRTALMLAIAAASGACSGQHQVATRPPPASPEPSEAPTTATPSTSATPSAAATAPALPSVAPWRPGAGELEPAAKEAAVRRIEALGDDANHRVEIIDAQYGGLLASTASVLVVCRSLARRAGRVVAGGHTYDVRLVLRGGRWRVTEIHPSRPGRPTSDPSAAARHVLASPRIALPPAARADVASGTVHDTVLEAMLTVSRRWPIGVSVVRTGHPTYVFGTVRPSDHPLGRAFDTWRIADHAIVRPSTPPGLITAYMEALAGAGSYNVGGPILLGSAPQYFSDRTHHDHVHAGFTA
ncbi:hypothetical protein [Nocardioides panacihumi]|uniref:hypothetical protein n=1 Tax=Nocardioides panacihumi TaxID=400774 RepID=UPI0031DADC4A